MKKILIVDDDTNLCELLENRLEANGYKVVQASNGVEAFVKASDEKPDLIILDVSMPTMNGLEFVQATRWLEMKSIPIIVLTALVDTREVFNTFGVENFVTKPFDSNVLLEKIAECIKD
jgi:two-component system, OmpR family, response regulator VanR